MNRNPMEQIDVAVIGAGVTGLASALAIATRGLSVCVLERHPRPGLDTSTHNSGVIHGGIYYPAGTLKSRLCIEGRPLLYEFCAEARCRPREVRQADRRRRRRARCRGSRRSTQTRHRQRRRRPRDGRSRVRRGARAERPRASPRSVSPETGIVERRDARQGAAARGRGRRCHLPAGHAARRRDRGPRRHRASDRARNDSRGARSSTPPGCTRTTCRDCSAASASRSTRAAANTPSSPGEAIARQRARLSAAACAGHGLGVHVTRSTGGNVWLGPIGELSGAEGRLRKRSPAARGFRRSRRSSSCRW